MASPCSTASAVDVQRPPSENESGVTLRTPTTQRRSLRRGSAGASGRIAQRPRIRLSASARVRESCWKMPRTAEVIVRRARLADAAHRHAQVLGLDDDDDAARLQAPTHRVGDLRGQPLLHLRAAGVEVDDAGQLRQSGDPTVRARDVADGGGAVPRHEVVLARRVERDVLDQHELAVVLVEGRLENLVRVDVQAAEDLGERARHPGRRGLQALTVGVLADREQQLADGRLGPGRRRSAASALNPGRHPGPEPLGGGPGYGDPLGGG